MIGEKVTRAASRGLSKLLIDADAVEILRQRPAVVVDENIKAVVDKLGILFPAGHETLDAAAKCVVLVADFASSRR